MQTSLPGDICSIPPVSNTEQLVEDVSLAEQRRQDQTRVVLVQQHRPELSSHRGASPQGYFTQGS